MFGPKIKLPLGRIRRAAQTDVPAIEELITKECRFIFGNVDIGILIETATLAVSQLDTANNLIGFIALFDYPNVPALPQSDWPNWCSTIYRQNLQPHGTLFIHLMAWDKIFNWTFLKSAFTCIFMNDFYLQHIVMVMPPDSPFSIFPDDSIFCEVFIKTVAPEFKDATRFQCLYITQRQKWAPRMKIRKAVEEDNDDIIPIIDRQCDRLRQLYGDFYISELVALQNNPDNTRVMLVAEHDAFAVGVMVLNSVANLDYLHEKYELGPFWGLRKVTPEEKARMAENTYKEEAWTRKQNVVRKTSLLHENQDLILKDSQIKGAKPYHFLKDTNAGHTMHEDVEDQSSQVSKSGSETNSTFSKPVDFEGGPEKSPFGESSLSVNSSRATNCTVKERDSSNLSEVFLYDSDDSLEFDIMNVDKKLLRVPDILSYDTYYSGYRRHPQRSVEKEPTKKKMFRKVRSSVFRAESKITVPVYSGGPNAFVIEIFAFHEDHDERHGFDILEVAFEIFPDLDYCILSIPTDVTIYPLLEHFTLVCPRPFTCLTQALYLIHRNSILGKLRMRLADPYDSPSIALLSQNAPRSKEVMEIFHSTVQTRHSTHASQSYVLLSEEQVVGVAIIDVATEEEMCLVRTKYSVAGRAGGVKAPDGVGSVSVLLLQPAMQTHARFFARELLRCSGHEGLFWTLRLRERIDASPGRDLISTIAEFVPSHPRRTVSYDYDALPDFKVEVDSLSRVRSPYALWFINARICSLPKIDINRNIVLVGASKTALAFLEELLFGPSSAYLTFTNITLVSPHGIPTAVNCTRAADHMQPYMGRYNDRFFKSVPFICYVNVIAGTMTAINRADKFITVNTDQLFYDMLFLFCGEQYQHPDYLRDAMEVEKSYLGGKKYFHWSADNPARKSFENVVPPDPPENVFIVNDIIDANRSLNQLREIIGERKEYTVLVYGSTIHAYCCITALLELGVPGSNIKFFEPFPPENPNIHRVNFFNSPEVDLRVNDSIRAQGVSIYEGYYFEEWLVNEESGLVHSVKFLSYYMEVIVPCIAMFYYGTKGVNVNTFTAVNDAGLVYDGRLVINLDFETNDPYIYAAGPLTKYSRKYYADNFLHKYYSGCEIGKKVGEMIRNRLDPFKDESMEPTFNSSVLDQGIAFAASSNAFFNRSGLDISSSIDMSGIYMERDLDSRSGTTNDMTSILEQPAQELFYAKQHKRSEIFARFELPRFKEPLVTACIFPGGLNYLYVTKPGPQIPLAAAIEMRTTYGHVIETEENGYFRLHLNMDKKVETITCLTRETLDVYNLVSLWGKHEKLLNNMVVRYELDTIDNLYDYFKEPWCYAVFHDRFEELLQYIRNVIPPKMGHHGKTLKEEVDMMTLISNLQATVSTGAADLETVVNDLATNLRRKYDNFGYKSIIMDALLEWVDDNEDLLPMYAHPRLIRTLVLDLCHSPAFNVID